MPEHRHRWGRLL